MSVALTVRAQFTEGDKLRDAGNKIPEDVARFTDIVYGEDPKWQCLDVYRPKGLSDKLPVIISFHGGGWVYGDKDGYQWYTMSLAERGFAVVNFTYRLAPEFNFPSPLEDMNSVVRWVLENEDKYNFDINNVFAVGDSAGAHGLALYNNILVNKEYAKFYQFKAPDFRFKAIALNCGAYRIDIKGEELTSQLMKEYLPKDVYDSGAKQMQVLDYIVKGFPPTFVMTSDGDFLKVDAGAIVPVLLANDIEHELHFYVGKDEPLGHVFHCNVKLADASKCNDDECEFFKKYVG